MAAIMLPGLVAPAPYTKGFLPFWHLYAVLTVAPGIPALSPILAALFPGSALVVAWKCRKFRRVTFKVYEARREDPDHPRV